jgi:hypothetical protein
MNLSRRAAECLILLKNKIVQAERLNEKSDAF